MAIPNDQFTSWDPGTFVSVADTFDSWRKKTNGLKVDIGTQITTHVGAVTGAHVASAISSTTFGTIAATNVQTALNEIWSESARSDDARLSDQRTPSDGSVTNAKVAANAAIDDTKLAIISSAGKVSNSATTGTTGNTGSTLVLRDTTGFITVADPTAETHVANKKYVDTKITIHIHGNITSDGKIGNAAAIPIITGTAGILQAGSFGTTVGTFCQGNDARLSDQRTPSDGSVTNAKVAADAAIDDTKLATISTALKVSNSATTATSSAGNNTIVARDNNGGFAANVIAANILSVGSGTAGAPSIAFTGNLNTGIFRAGANTVNIAAGGLNAAEFTWDTAENGAQLQIFDGSVNGPLLLDHLNGIGRVLKNGTGSMQVGTSGTGTLSLLQNNTARITIANGGNVGIGTTTPTVKLDVNGDIRAANITTAGQLYINNEAPTIFLQDTNNRSAALLANDNKFYVLKGNGTNSANYTSDRPFVVDLNNLRVGINVDTPTATLDVYGGTLGGTAGNELALSNFRFSSDNNSRLAISAFRTANGNTWPNSAIILGMDVDTSVRPSSGTKGPAFMSLSGNGGVGIGAQDPLGKLHIHETTGTEASVTAGTLILTHGNAGGASSIVFPSKGNGTATGNDYGYIQYQDDLTINGTGEKGRLIIGIENDNVGANEDCIILKTAVGGRVGINTMNPTATLDVNGNIRTITPTDNLHAATKGYVDGLIATRAGDITWLSSAVSLTTTNNSTYTKHVLTGLPTTTKNVIIEAKLSGNRTNSGSFLSLNLKSSADSTLEFSLLSVQAADGNFSTAAANQGTYPVSIENGAAVVYLKLSLNNQFNIPSVRVMGYII